MMDELSTPRNCFIFLDPPYMISSYLYGTDAKLHKSFDHDKFVDDCAVCPFDWMVTYNNDDYLKQKYRDFYQEEFQITYGMKHRANNHLKKELLVANYDINPVSPLETLINA
jgi:DNA adenine methylase